MRLTYLFANKYLVSERVMIKYPRFPQESLMFGCCPVRIATLLVGLWHLAIHLLGFILFISAFYLAADYCKVDSIYNVGRFDDVSHHSVYSNTPSEYHSLDRGNDMKLWAVMSILSFAAVALLISGVLKKKSTLILPFFFLQLFDLLFDLTILIVYIMLSSNVNEFFSQLYKPPFQRFLVRFTFYQRTIFASLYIVISFFAKAYLMYVIYSCYRYLSAPQKADHERNSLVHENENSNEVDVRLNQTEVLS